MPGIHCAIAKCNNSKKKYPDLSFHRFPKNDKLRKEWIDSCSREEKFNADNSYVCSDHFDPDDFEYDLRSKLMPYPSKKQLKRNVVPHCNLPGSSPIDSPQSIDSAEQLEVQKDQENIFAPSAMELEVEYVENDTENKKENEEKTSVKKIKGSGSCCSVASCKNTGRLKAKTGQDIRFHRFPKDPDVRREWIRKCGRKERFNPDTATICSDHFTPEDYMRDLRSELLGLGHDKKKLLPDSVPHLNLPPEIQKKIRKRRDRELTEGEKIAQRKKLVAEAIEWADSLLSAPPEEGAVDNPPKAIVQKNYANPAGLIHIAVKPSLNLTDISARKTISENNSLQPPKSTPSGVSKPTPTTPTKSNDTLGTEAEASPETSEMMMDFVDTSPSSSQINLREDQSKWDKNTYRRKYSELLSNYEELDTKYKRCYKVLCCFKVAYTKLRSQNNAARTKIIELREKNKNIQRQLKQNTVEKKTRKQSKFIQTDPFEDDVNGWW